MSNIQTCAERMPLVFFFFQAEDGIRDGTVTGVQTCALPISNPCDTAPYCVDTISYHRLTFAQSNGESPPDNEIGRASCRERVKTSEVADLLIQEGQIGRLVTISPTPVIAGYSFEMYAVGSRR